MHNVRMSISPAQGQQAGVSGISQWAGHRPLPPPAAPPGSCALTHTRMGLPGMARKLRFPLLWMAPDDSELQCVPFHVPGGVCAPSVGGG